MLQHLFIKDLAIVAQAEVNFSNGMTVITGETGAGKSILLDALSLALGERSDSHLIRPGCERAEIAAVFDISRLPDAVLWLSDLELTQEEDLKQCIIRRIIYPQGRSKAFINGRPVTGAQLRLLGEYLVQIHGQHQHQLLLKPQEQLRLLDAFGQHDALISQVRTTYHEWEKISQQKHALLQSSQVDQAKRDLLQYQRQELDTLALGEHEFTLLHQEHDKQSHAQEYIENANHVLALLDHHEDGNTLQFLERAQHGLRPFADNIKAITNTKVCLDNAYIQLKEAALELDHFVQSIEADPEQLAHIEQRLAQIYEMARKHKIDPQYLYMHHQQLKKQLAQFDNLEETLQQFDRDLKLISDRYHRIAKQLTEARMHAKEKLTQEVTACIRRLAMPDAIFDVCFKPQVDGRLHAFGEQTVQFAISANAGHTPQPLNKIASGGELSRISLALELILAKYVATPCLIFDEVDVGISGKIGAIVGQALHDLARQAQVLCITHLPQVAAMGDHHFQVTKHRMGNDTVSEIAELKGNARVEAIAKMLGGIDVTAQAKANAKQLLKEKIT